MHDGHMGTKSFNLFRGAISKLVVLLSMTISVSACSLVSYIVAPSETKITLENDNPLRSSMADMHTLAIAHPELVTGAGTAERTHDTKQRVEFNMPVVISLTEQLQENKRFAILSPTQFASAFDGGAQNPFRTGISAMTADERKKAYMQAGQILKADGVIVIEVGQMALIGHNFLRALMGDARFEHERRLTMRVIETKTGNEIWSQRAVAYYFVKDAAKADADMFPTMRAALVKNFHDTAK